MAKKVYGQIVLKKATQFDRGGLFYVNMIGQHILAATAPVVLKKSSPTLPLEFKQTHFSRFAMKATWAQPHRVVLEEFNPHTILEVCNWISEHGKGTWAINRVEVGYDHQTQIHRTVYELAFEHRATAVMAKLASVGFSS